MVTALSSCATVAYLITMVSCMVLVYAESEDYSNDFPNQCVEFILEFLMGTTGIYIITLMNSSGTLYLEIIFEQFDFELINEIPDRKKPASKINNTPHPNSILSILT